MNLPEWLTELLSNPPQAGNGVHHWLFTMSLRLHRFRLPEESIALLEAAVADCGRHVSRGEIAEAVYNSIGVEPRHETCGGLPKPRPLAWPSINPEAREQAIKASAVQTLADLAAISPCDCSVHAGDPEFYIDALFAGNPLLCVGLSANRFQTAPRESFRGELAAMQFVVPNAMSALTGFRKKDRAQSPRTLDNTGPRLHQVVEFDSGTPDDQAALIGHLKTFGPLALVLSSGGKSLHSWWPCAGCDESELREFIDYAVSLGADSATWSRCQLVRLPEGVRSDNGARQTVHYFDPAAVKGGAA